MKEDRDTVVERFLPKIKRMAKRLRSRFPRVGTDDLEQAGAQGLLKAWERHDPTKGTLSTFAQPWIRGEMLMHVRSEATSHRYENEAAAAVDEAYNKHASGIGNSLIENVLEAADAYSVNAYSSRTPEDELLTQETLADVNAFCAELSERDREFVRLRFQETLTLEEIGQVLGHSRSALCRVEQRLRAKLARRIFDGD